MANTKTYAAKKVQVVYGTHTLVAYMEDSFVEIERDSDSFTKMVGADGEVARAANADRSGKLKVKLQQVSISNDVLSTELNIDEATNVNTKPCMVKDGSGRTLWSTAEAWISKPANVVFSKGIEGREWTIEAGVWLPFTGGN